MFWKASHLSLVPSGGPDDEVLLSRLRAGEVGAANELVRRAGPRAKAAVRRLLRGRSPDDDDLLQLVLIELVGTIDAFRGDCSLNTWIDRIAAHVVFKRLRRQKLERRLFDGLGEPSDDLPSGHSTDRRVLTQSVLSRVQALVAHLDSEKVMAWLMLDVHGLSLEELAHALEITVAAAQSRASRARREVRACLEADAELSDVLSSWEALS
jgi:RNA polymerase sigma-70 factor, ECF subfamily